MIRFWRFFAYRGQKYFSKDLDGTPRCRAHSRSPKNAGGIAQLGERQLCKLDVAGSIPVASTKHPEKSGNWFAKRKPIGVDFGARSLKTK